MRRSQRVGALLLVFGILAQAGYAVQAESSVEDVVRRAQRSAEDQQAMMAYYKYSREEETREKTAPLTVRATREEAPESEISFEVKEVRVTKSQILTDEEVQEAVHFKGAGASNVSELQEMVNRLNALYVEKGIPTAQAVLPPQTVKDGIVYIRLIEGTFGKVEITGNDRISQKSIRDRIRARSGELVNVDRLRDDLLRYNATNVYQIQAELVPGEEEGTSDLYLTLHENKNPLTTFLFVDNAGQGESGRTRLGLYTEYRGLNGRDSALSVAPIWTQGIWGGSVSYDTPIGTRGTRMAVSYSRNMVNIIHGVFRDFDMKANSDDLGISLSHPLRTTSRIKTDLFLEVHKKSSQTQYSGMDMGDIETKTLKFGISQRSFDRRGLWFFMGSVTGYDNDDNYRNKEKNGSYYSAYLLRRQNLPWDQYLSLRLVGQYTSHQELPTTEQFTLGGFSTVRAFQESALSGDKGWLASVEYGFPLSEDHRTVRAFLFWDYGMACNNYSVREDKARIASVGVGLEVARGTWYAKAVLGFPYIDSKSKFDREGGFHFYLQKSI